MEKIRKAVESIMKKNVKLLTLVTASMFLAVAYILPFFTGQISQIGNMLCPMHLPVLLCGFFCGAVWGGLVGIIAPILRSVTLGMPILFPTAICMAVELGTYGCVSGGLYRILPKKKISVYLSLLTAMVAGRIVWGIAMLMCTGIGGNSFGIHAFLTSTVINAIPGILLQIVLIPILVLIFDKNKLNSEQGSL